MIIRLKSISYESFMKGLPWIMLFVGILFILVGVFAFDKADAKAPFFLITIGQAVLVSGVFSVLLKSLQFMNIFREELAKVVYGDDFFNILNDDFKKDLWVKITSSIHSEKFPKLSKYLHQSIIEQYLPANKEHYYENYRRVSRIKWHDESKNIIHAQEQIEMSIIPSDISKEIRYKFKYTSDLGDESVKTRQELERLIINNISYKEKLKENVYEDEQGKRKIRYEYDIPLKGETEYKVCRVINKYFSLEVDPYSRYFSETFIHGSSVKVTVIPSNLNVQFLSSGTLEDYIDRGVLKGSNEQDDRRQIDKEYLGLLFPKQGYVLYYYRV